MKKRRRRFLPAFISCLTFSVFVTSFPVSGEEQGEVSYRVSFVDEEDRTRAIFPVQKGSVMRSSLLTIDVPKTIIGLDGHLWIATEDTPKTVRVSGWGMEKYEITYHQGKKLVKEEISEGEKRLHDWCRKSRERDEAILGEESAISDPLTIVSTEAEVRRRLQTLTARIEDANWHEFYLIGKNIRPETKWLGEGFDGLYSVLKEDDFTVKEDRYLVLLVRVKRTEIVGKEDPPIEDGEQSWKVGDRQIRTVGDQEISFHCIDSDYQDGRENHKQKALFLADTIIPSNVITDPNEVYVATLSFGDTNNYKYSKIRSWLHTTKAEEVEILDASEIGVETAYLGRSMSGEYGQVSVMDFQAHALRQPQTMTDKFYPMSLEEALTYRDFLWKFGSEKDNPQTQKSPYSMGYYLRTPYYEVDADGDFVNGEMIYVVDLDGSIHPADVKSDAYGIRPMYTIDQG